MRKRSSMLYSIILLGFLIGIHNGKIALWRDNNPTPVKVFPYRAEILPEADQSALRKGIRINNITDIQRLLQDYLS